MGGLFIRIPNGTEIFKTNQWFLVFDPFFHLFCRIPFHLFFQFTGNRAFFYGHAGHRGIRLRNSHDAGDITSRKFDSLCDLEFETI